MSNRINHRRPHPGTRRQAIDAGIPGAANLPPWELASRLSMLQKAVR